MNNRSITNSSCLHTKKDKWCISLHVLATRSSSNCFFLRLKSHFMVISQKLCFKLSETFYLSYFHLFFQLEGLAMSLYASIHLVKKFCGCLSAMLPTDIFIRKEKETGQTKKVMPTVVLQML